ncbi:MAG: hypothetical protein K8S18_08425 [Desulfobacula sp.]|nr:hypothetical protein [Desulfobacula sp.]
MITDYITFIVKTESGGTGLLLVSPELGNYSVIHHASLNYVEGQHIDFFCPVCHENLGMKKLSSDLAEVIMVDENGNEYEIIFSEIAGKKCTYKVKNQNIIASFGKDSDEHTNFWGEYPKY